MALDVEEVVAAFGEFAEALREDPCKAEVFAMFAFPAFVQMAFDERFALRLAEEFRGRWEEFEDVGTPEGLAASVPHLLCALLKALAAESDASMRGSR
jgi:hypothetical protein